jgi:hypothetical protein
VVLTTEGAGNAVNFTTGILVSGGDPLVSDGEDAYFGGNGWALPQRDVVNSSAWDETLDFTFRATFSKRPACDPIRGFVNGSASNDSTPLCVRATPTPCRSRQPHVSIAANGAHQVTWCCIQKL